VSSTSPATSAPTPRSGASEDVGYNIQNGPAPFFLAGGSLYELRNGELIVRDGKLAETSRLPLKNVSSATALVDGSLVVSTIENHKRKTHHVVNGAVVKIYDLGLIGALGPTEKATEVWSIDKRSANRDRFGADKQAHLLMPVEYLDLPEGPMGAYAFQPDGSVVVATQMGLTRCTATAATSFEWDGTARHVVPGPDGTSVWVSEDVRAVDLVKLDGGKVVPVKRFALAADETVIHLAGTGKEVVAVVATGEGPVTYALVAFTAAGKRWTTDLGAGRRVYQVAADDKRVVLRTEPDFELTQFDIATGKPL
jgi:hypothetical protein